MVFKPRQVQDVRIVKFKEILVIHIMIVRVQRRQIFFLSNYGLKSKLEFPQFELLAIEILPFDQSYFPCFFLIVAIPHPNLTLTLTLIPTPTPTLILTLTPTLYPYPCFSNAVFHWLFFCVGKKCTNYQYVPSRICQTYA